MQRCTSTCSDDHGAHVLVFHKTLWHNLPSKEDMDKMDGQLKKQKQKKVAHYTRKDFTSSGDRET